ncbi:hypothetical protein [Crossiella sp. CA198]|uniref:hypothetical protein n=1 Tax=Crossiella sp. CA198 TaxID=3455607 RepID=UPI003F8D546E
MERNALHAELLTLTAQLLTAHPDAPPVFGIVVTDTLAFGAMVEMQMRDPNSDPSLIAEWASRLNTAVRLRDHGTYVQVTLDWTTRTPTGQPAVIRVWSHFSPQAAGQLVRAAGTAFRNGTAALSVQQVRAAAGMQAKAVAA